jgi:hypothetical protein
MLDIKQNMIDFKPGDKVICTVGYTKPDMIEGGIYTVRNVYPDHYITIVEDIGCYFWDPFRFKKNEHHRNEKLNRIL